MFVMNRHTSRIFKRLRSSKEKGQSLVEFSLMVILMTSLLLGILDVGRAYFSFLALQDAAGEGVNYAAQFPTNTSSIADRVRSAAPVGTLVDWNSTTVSVITDTTATGNNQGSTITVTVTTSYQLITPFVGTIVGSQTLPLSANAVAIITTP